MKPIIQGYIDDLTPLIGAEVDARGILSFVEGGQHLFCVDTGFTGALCAPESLLQALHAVFVGYEPFTLATAQEVELPVFLGSARIGDTEIETRFVEGDALVGMEFLSAIASRLVVDMDEGTVRLERR